MAPIRLKILKIGPTFQFLQVLYYPRSDAFDAMPSHYFAY